jgi:Fe-S cluster biogenesis protein NfuA
MEAGMSEKPNESSSNPATPRERVMEMIAALRPYIQGDGGDIEFVDMTDTGEVHVRLHGACVGCPGATMTLTMGVETRLKQLVPEVQRVVRVP